MNNFLEQFWYLELCQPDSLTDAAEGKLSRALL